MLSFNFALSQRLKIDFNIKRRLRFVLASCFFAVLAHCERIYGALAIILYIYACYALYRVIRLCVRFDCDVPFLVHNRFGFGVIRVFLPYFLFSAVSTVSAVSAHINFLHLNTACRLTLCFLAISESDKSPFRKS